MLIRVKGGTGAGSKMRPQRLPWLCKCLIDVNALIRREHPAERYSCPDCGTRRPQ